MTNRIEKTTALFNRANREFHLFRLLRKTDKHIDNIKFFDSVEKQIKVEASRLANSISGSKTESEQKTHFYRFLTLNRAVDSIRVHRSISLFRRPSVLDCDNAETNPFINNGQEEPNWYYFFETYEYKFVLLFNFTKKTGHVIHMARASNKASLKNALMNASHQAETLRFLNKNPPANVNPPT